jgi:hypothetical protein
MRPHKVDREPSVDDPVAPRISVRDAAATVGMSARRLVELAAQGRVPGAAQMVGPRGRWSFSAVKLERWIDEREMAAECRQNVEAAISTFEVISGGAGSRSKGASTAEAFERLFGRKRKGTLSRGAKK